MSHMFIDKDNTSTSALSHETTEQITKLLFVLIQKFHSSRNAMSPVTDVKLSVRNRSFTELYHFTSWKIWLRELVGTFIAVLETSQHGIYTTAFQLGVCLKLKIHGRAFRLLLFLLVAAGGNISFNRLSEVGSRAWHERLCVINP